MILEILPQSAGINHTSQREAYLLVLSKTIAESQCHNCDGACCFLTSHMIGDPPRKESPQRGTVGDLKAWYALLCAPLCHSHHLVTVSPLLKSFSKSATSLDYRSLSRDFSLSRVYLFFTQLLPILVAKFSNLFPTLIHSTDDIMGIMEVASTAR
jgi:hypothetical protein